MAADALAPQRRQVINSHGIQYVLVSGHFRLFEFRLYWIRVLDSVKCPSFFYQLQGFLGHQDAMSWVVLRIVGDKDGHKILNSTYERSFSPCTPYVLQHGHSYSTHWGKTKMANILHRTFSDIYPWIKFSPKLFVIVHLTISHRLFSSIASEPMITKLPDVLMRHPTPTPIC